MINNLTFFESCSELSSITQLPVTDMWELGFNLDDMDWGFVINGVWADEFVDEYGYKYYDIAVKSGIPHYLRQLLDWMASYCVGYTCVVYDGKTYFTLHHA